MPAFSLVALMIVAPMVSHAAETRVAILPFRLNAQEDLAFLQDGILAMLSSRLSWDSKVIVFDIEETAEALATVELPLDEGKARQIGGGLRADYIIYGSLNLLGKRMSVDVKVADVAGAAATRSFYVESPDMDNVIPQINRLAGEINEEVFGRIPEDPLALRPPSEERPSIYAHPERLISEKPVEPEPPPIPGKPVVAPAAAQEATEDPAGVWQSSPIGMRIRGLDLGDVDGDGQVEAAVISSRKVIIYRLLQKRPYKVHETKGKGYQEFIAVDVADINHNGRAEVFITCLNATSGILESFVIEWNGSSFLPIAGLEKWYFRVQHHPDRGDLLLGQRGSRGGLFYSAVRELAWDGQAYTPQQEVQLPGRVALYDFTRGDILNDGSSTVLALDDRDRLRIYDGNGRQRWKSDDSYSGSENFLEHPDEPEKLVYLHHRLIVTDLNGDGKYEVLLVNNQGSTGRYFQRYRRFSSGRFESLSWNGLGLASVWQSPRVSGYISDYAIGDIDNDGEPELVGAVVSSRGSLITEAKSAMVAFDLGPRIGEH